MDIYDNRQENYIYYRLLYSLMLMTYVDIIKDAIYNYNNQVK